MKKILFSFLFCSSLVVATMFVEGCYYDRESELYGPTSTTTTCDTSTAKFATFVSPLIASSCASSSCHSATTKAGSINLSSHTAIKAYITSSKATFIGSIKRTSGYSPMPDGAAKLPDCSITKIEAWITAGMQNN